MSKANEWPLKKEGYSQVKGLIESIENDRNAEPFMAPVEWEGKYFAHVDLIERYCRDGFTRLPTDCEESNGFGHGKRKLDGCEIFDV